VLSGSQDSTLIIQQTLCQTRRTLRHSLHKGIGVSAGEISKLGRFVGHSTTSNEHSDGLGDRNYVLGFGWVDL
jgi:hypothetical protein